MVVIVSLSERKCWVGKPRYPRATNQKCQRKGSISSIEYASYELVVAENCSKTFGVQWNKRNIESSLVIAEIRTENKFFGKEDGESYHTSLNIFQSKPSGNH